MLLVAVGMVSLLLIRPSHALPLNLQAAAITRHDICSPDPVHVSKGVPQRFAAMGQYLSANLKHPVLVADLTKDHWDFRGAAICRVGDTMSAHLLFAQSATRTISVFSIAAASFPGLRDKQLYEGTDQGHAIVARREGNAIYCLVGYDPHGSITVDDLSHMLKDHQTEVAVASTPRPAGQNVRLALSIAREE